MESINILPTEARAYYNAVYEKSVAKGNDSLFAEQVAWDVVKSKFEKQGTEWVARNDAFVTTEFYTFNAEHAEEFVSRTDEGHLVQRYVLTDLLPDVFGTKPTQQLMNKWAEWINTNTPEVDADHELWNAVIETHKGNTELIERAMRAKKGIARAINAVVERGKLIVNILFDKRYERYADTVKGLSVEAGITQKQGKTWVDGNIFGFTFAKNRNPANPRSVRIIS
jgi:hypothetical protein